VLFSNAVGAPEVDFIRNSKYTAEIALIMCHNLNYQSDIM